MDRCALSEPGANRVRALRAAVTALLLYAASVAAAADALWDRAVAMVQAGEHLEPETIVTWVEEREIDGKIKSIRQTESRARVRDGVTTYEVVREVQDGQPVDLSGTDGTTQASPNRFWGAFDADLSSMSGVKRDDKQHTIRGQRAIGYRVDQPTADYTLRAQVWISKQGEPLELHYTVDPLPRFVQAMAIRAEYDLQDGRVLISRMFAQVVVNVPLVYRRLISFTVELTNYFDPDA